MLSSSGSRTRTYDIMINSHALLPTELWRIKLLSSKNSPYGIRTRVTAVKRRCLNPLTNGPSSEIFISLTLLLLYQSIRFCLYFFSKKILNFAKFIRILRQFLSCFYKVLTCCYIFCKLIELLVPQLSWIEHSPSKRTVAGSNPAGIKCKMQFLLHLFFFL